MEKKQDSSPTPLGLLTELKKAVHKHRKLYRQIGLIEKRKESWRTWSNKVEAELELVSVSEEIQNLIILLFQSDIPSIHRHTISISLQNLDQSCKGKGIEHANLEYLAHYGDEIISGLTVSYTHHLGHSWGGRRLLKTY
ncbi:MAG: hypothetical protein V1763_03240 [Parcubacteria group bacterium]